MKRTIHRPRVLLPILLLVAAVAQVAQAAPKTTSDLLLPYFEVSLEGSGVTTLFAVVNTSPEEQPVQVAVHSNWGIEVLRVPLLLPPEGVQSINLRDWLVDGNLPQGQTLEADELAHVAAALCGEASPKDGLYYSTAISTSTGAGLAVGYVTVRTLDHGADVLTGDYFVVDPAQDLAQGEMLVDIDPADACGSGLCRRHALRFLEGGGFDSGTELIVWTQRQATPVTQPIAAAEGPVVLDASAFEEPGVHLGDRQLGLLPVQVVRLADLDLGQPFGWLDLTTDVPSWVGVRYTAGGRYSVALGSACLALLTQGPGLEVEKYTNGSDADAAPGVHVAPGSEVEWQYVVTNTGSVPLTDVTVSDDDPSLELTCDGTSLAVGEHMLCTAVGVAQACGYRNVAVASGTTAEGEQVFAHDPSHYFGDVPASISLALTVNGHVAREFPGPHFAPGTPLAFHWTVENDGVSDLTGVTVTDDAGTAVDCPRDTLAAGGSMVCTSTGVADGEGGRVTGRVRGDGRCDARVEVEDVAYYQCGHCVEEPPAIHLEKATNGHDADQGPGPVIAPGTPVTWTYVVSNAGASDLDGVSVADDDPALSVSCPQSSLAVGESMTCTAHGVAGEGPYANLGTARATSTCGQVVVDADASHYLGTADTPDADQGCTPGYWKNHTDSWPPTGYAPAQSVESVFAQAAAYPAIGSASLLEALAFHGGSGVEGGARNLLRAAVAALLNASHPGVEHPRGAAAVIADVDAALASGDRAAMLTLAAALDADNNLGCPLS